MANTAFVDDEEIAQSIRKITAQRNLKRFVALGSLVLAVLGFVAAIVLSYGGVHEPTAPPTQTNTR